MAYPAKVMGFLDVAGAWDPSLLLVLGGAVGVTVISFRFVRLVARPALEPSFEAPPATRIDGALFVGAGLFGIGWGLSDSAPGPASRRSDGCRPMRSSSSRHSFSVRSCTEASAVRARESSRRYVKKKRATCPPFFRRPKYSLSLSLVVVLVLCSLNRNAASGCVPNREPPARSIANRPSANASGWSNRGKFLRVRNVSGEERSGRSSG